MACVGRKAYVVSRQTGVPSNAQTLFSGAIFTHEAALFVFLPRFDCQPEVDSNWLLQIKKLGLVVSVPC